MSESFAPNRIMIRIVRQNDIVRAAMVLKVRLFIPSDAGSRNPHRPVNGFLKNAAAPRVIPRIGENARRAWRGRGRGRPEC